MRWTVPLLAVVIAIGIAATVDALRDGDDEADTSRPAAPGTGAPPARAAKLRAAGVTGELYFTVETEAGCRLRALSLPTLQDAASFELSWCRFDLSRDGNVVSGPSCPGRTFEIRSVDELSGGFQGCAPAWKPSGELTFVRDGDVLTPTGDVLVDDVARFARNALGRGRLVVRQLAWLSDTRLAALIGARTANDGVVIVIEGDRAFSEPIFADRRTTLDVLRHSQELFVGGEFGGLVFDEHGNFVTAGRFPFADLAAVAESPGGRWFAVARPASLCVYEQTDPPPREYFPITCLEADAVDLAWR
jgi:hypothetical protein